MIELYPKVSKVFLNENELVYIVKNQLKAFFTSEKVNVFTAFTNHEVLLTDDIENADIIYSPSKDMAEQSYEIVIDEKINVSYGDGAGAYYASVTLNQLFTSNEIEYCTIVDAPQVKVRGFMYDISRDKVSTVKTIKEILDIMAGLKMNHFELYVEGFSFEYKSFPQYLEEDGYITTLEYKELEKYANDRFIDFVPNQNGFGHMTDWLAKDEFKDLRICPNGSYIWGRNRKASTLNPLNKESVELVKKMYADMLPLSNSKYFNMNFDEPFELGLDLTEEAAKEVGIGNIYLDFVLKVYDEIKKYNKIPLIWGDVLIKHRDLLYKLPKDMIFIDWAYEGNYKFGKHGIDLTKRGVKYMCAPGTTSWCSWSTRTTDWHDNITNAVRAVKRHEGLGVLLTDWGDFGHLQFLPMSYAPLVYCGIYSWDYREGSIMRVRNYLNKYIFKDENGFMGDWMMDFGEYYHLEPSYYGNQTATFRTFMWTVAAIDDVASKEVDDRVAYFEDKMKGKYLDVNRYKTFKKYFDYMKYRLEFADMKCDDAEIIKKECIQSIDVLSMIQDVSVCYNDIDTCEKIKILNNVLSDKDRVIKTQKELWLARNKKGGLAKSISYLERFYEFVETSIEYITKKEKKYEKN